MWHPATSSPAVIRALYALLCVNMSLPFFLPSPAALLLPGINRLLGRESWARERLATHGGKAVRVSLGAWSWQASIQADGRLLSCDSAVVPDVTLSIPAPRLSELPGVWHRHGMEGAISLAHIQGDAGLARVVSDLGQGLRWDIEGDLARVVGDVMAVRLTRGARQMTQGAQKILGHAQANLTEYLAEESHLLLSAPDFHAWRGDLQRLQARLDALDQRVQRLPGATTC